jgi:Zn-dependent protease
MMTIRIFNTPVKVSLKFLPIFVVLWGCVSWLGVYWHPGRTLWQGLLIGLITSVLLLLAELGHPVGHIFSARLAGAPMDEILITADMPRTIYKNNNVAPKVHRMRALGGITYNLACLLISLVIFAVSAHGSLLHELMTWSAFGHAMLILMSLVPVPMVDGGSILKWTLVERGRTERAADAVVRQVDWAFGILLVVVGVVLIFLGSWIIGLILLGVAGVVFGIAAGKVRWT